MTVTKIIKPSAGPENVFWQMQIDATVTPRLSGGPEIGPKILDR